MKILGILITFVAGLLLLPAKLSAQKQVVTGKIVLGNNAQHDEPLPYANVSLLQLPDSSFVKGTVSDEQGRFVLAFTRRQRTAGYVLKASYTGCAPVFTPLSSRQDTVRFNDIRLEEEALNLKEIVVTAPIKAMEQRGDTTIYNAEAYPTPEGAYLEELVKRIPGLSYNSEDHTLTYNGYTINEITVNGKDFFKGNREVVLENLPVKFISQLKVYDKPTKEEEATGMKSTKKNYVLDLQTKKEMNGALLLSAEAGYGTHKRRDINGRGMHFKDNGDNFMVTGQSTNRYSTTTYEGNISNSAGINVTKVKEELEISGNVSFSNSRNGSESSAYSEQYLSTGNQYALSESDRMSKGNNLQSNLSMTWKADTLTTVNLSGGFGFSNTHSNDRSKEATLDTNPQVDTRNPFEHFDRIDPHTRINDNSQQSQMSNRYLNYDINASVIRRLNKKGNNISLGFSTTQNHHETENYTLASTHYFRLQNAAGNDSIHNQNQYQLTPGREQRYNLNLAYTQVLTDKSRLQFSYEFSSNREKLDGNTYDLSAFSMEEMPVGTLPQGYEAGHIDSLGNRSNSRTTGHQLSLQFTYNGEIWGVQTALAATPQRRMIEKRTGAHQADTTVRSTEWRPSFTVTYRNADNYAMIAYNGNTLQPLLSDLIAPTDYSSPLNISRSNPNLRASYTHYIYTMYNNFVKGVMVAASWNQTFNSVTRATVYNPETGGRETFPVNINGNWGVSGNASYDKRFGLFRTYLTAAGYFNRDVSLIDEGYGQSGTERSITRSTNLNSNLRLSYLPSWGNIDLNGRWMFYQSKNSLQNRNTYTRTYTVGLESSVNLPLNLIFQTDANYHFRNGTGITGNDDNEILWNIKLSWKFLKEKSAELSLYWADILSQRKSLSRSASATGFYERYEEQLRGYFMVSFKYELNQMN